MKLEIVARAGEIFSGTVKEIVVPAYDGELGILPGRAPILAVLKPGTVRYVTQTGEREEIRVGKGFLTVDHDEVMIVVENYKE
ncbi:ATP synthase F1 subunit epsilon [Arcanobacterium pinnipediorum]|uniref:ATP synthase F1 subunit epsilon n=1 Tax=Arcanobacterium pinnipediorum TaxID=1503041 RepID=A0ABY5AIP6_9ACTO|nr:ATP synthase F1 subunit epsilon [Arcanobacterium pinnipediorum]USR79722.1 ATP synthase F1 subunit epsilon [Arcanobacterium pinnipediorum]